MSDILASFAKHRQPMIIRTLLCRRGVERIEISGAEAVYRSSDEIRTVIAELSKRPCFAPPAFDRGDVPTPFRNSARKRLYETLTGEFGPMCQSCGQRYGHLVDHDHFSGVVRGLLCRVCNTWVDSCVHADSAVCRYAHYLNSPPAERLRLRYPANHRQRALDEVRRLILGFEILDPTSWPSTDPTDWSWSVPDQAQLEEVAAHWRSQSRASALRRRQSMAVDR